MDHYKDSSGEIGGKLPRNGAQRLKTPGRPADGDDIPAGHMSRITVNTLDDRWLLTNYRTLVAAVGAGGIVRFRGHTVVERLPRRPRSGAGATRYPPWRQVPKRARRMSMWLSEGIRSIGP